MRRSNPIGDWSNARWGALALRVACVLALIAPMLVHSVSAQQTMQMTGDNQAPAPPPAEPAPPARNFATGSGGLLEAVGRWFDQGSANFRSHLQGANRSVDDLNQRAAATTRNIGETAVGVSKNAVDAGIAAADVTKDAVGTVAKLPLTRVITGRERCELAPNGAPDCQAAAELLCRKRGFATGTSMDFTSAEQCNARAMLAGRDNEADCRTVTFISRAMCQ